MATGRPRASCTRARPEANAVVVWRLLTERGVGASERTIQRAVADLRRAQRAVTLATVRVETPPGDQLQIDFGQKRVLIAGVAVRIFLLVAVLSYSRRLFVKAFLNQRGDDCRAGHAQVTTTNTYLASSPAIAEAELRAFEERRGNGLPNLSQTSGDDPSAFGKPTQAVH